MNTFKTLFSFQRIGYYERLFPFLKLLGAVILDFYAVHLSPFFLTQKIVYLIDFLKITETNWRHEVQNGRAREI